MTWTVDQPCEVEVTRGKWVAGIVISASPQLRVKTLGGDLVRPSPGSIREPKASSSLRHAVPPPSSEVAEAASHEPTGKRDYSADFAALWGSARDVFAGVPRDERGVPDLDALPPAVVKQVARVTELRRVPKPEKPWRSSKHLAHVRSLSCCVCGAGPQSEAHHVGPHPMGRKVSDAQTAPLCGIDHTEFHLTGRHRGSRAMAMAVQWHGVMAAAKTALHGLSDEDKERLIAEAAEAAAMVWVKALEGRDAAEESET
jgi:hypothetical protein